MALESGRRLGPYEILASIGAGGMGEVYEAKDTRLGRTVAIKVLPEGLAESPERRARFEREARTVSQLSHPHVCTLHDVGEEEGIHFLVLEHCEGETLAQRLTRGELSLGDTLRYGAQIAEALDAAHRRGIVHRDLKPANVMLTASGVKLLDFGLARLAAEGKGSVDDLPTMTQKEGRELTDEGTVLGTFPYMSPEQVEGGEADSRSDLFSLGAVLYEMATGRRAFEGKSAASVMAAILRAEPEPLSRLQPVAPPALDHVVSRCLAKDPEERWQNAKDVAVELRWVAEAGSQAGVAAPVARRRKSRERLAWGVAAALAATVVALGGLLVVGSSPEAVPPTARFVLPPPDGLAFEGLHAVSPDGRHLVFEARDEEGRSRLWLRSLDTLEAHALPGTEGGSGPFWSPDGDALAFFADGELKRYDLGGTVRTLCRAVSPRGGSWSHRGVILFGDEGSDVKRVPVTGGLPESVAIVEAGEGVLVFWPHFLPDGDRFLVVVFHPEKGGVYLGSLSSEERRHLLSFESIARLSRVEYDPTGHLLYVRDGALLAQPVDPNSLALRGDATRIADRVLVGGPGVAHFSISRNGVLVLRESSASRDRQLTWLDRSGTAAGSVGPPGRWQNVELSPDGTQVAVTQEGVGDHPSVWLVDVTRGTSVRFASGYFAVSPSWSPTGDALAFAAAIEGPPNPFLLAMDGRGAPERLARFRFQAYPQSWSPDGSFLLVSARRAADTGWDVLRVPLTAPGAPEPVLAGPFDELSGHLSSDGRWLAYVSNETGREEVYVTSFPDPGRRWQISTGGGGRPRWRADGEELYYLAPDRSLMAVEVSAERTFSAGLPRSLFEVPDEASYAVSADGERFLVAVPTGERISPPLVVSLDWRAGAEIEPRIGSSFSHPWQ